MSTSATITLSGRASPQVVANSNGTTPTIYQVGSNQPRGQVFHVGGNKPGSASYYEPSHGDPNNQSMNTQAPKLAYSASNYPGQQQQQQQQYQMQQQFQPQQHQITQQNNFQQYPQQHQQMPYQPHEQPQQQQQFIQPTQQQQFIQPTQQQQNFAQPQQFIQPTQQQQNFAQPQQFIQPTQQQQNFASLPPQGLSIQTRPSAHTTSNAGPVFEAPVEKMHIVKRNQSVPPPKFAAHVMQQSIKSSRSGSVAGFDEITEPPRFILHPKPLQPVTEGESVTLTARVAPAGDPYLTVQWYKDGIPLTAGSRFNTSFERGFSVLDILYSFKEDEGEYSCVAKNNFGMDQTTPIVIVVNAEDNVIQSSSLPVEMSQSIAAMEANLNTPYAREERTEGPSRQPQFVKPMPSVFNMREGQPLHLETRFIPTGDNSLVLEWYKNGKQLDNSCRFNIINDRGFAILDILGVISEDAGDYFCVAGNKSGQAQSNVVRVGVTADDNIVTTSQLPQESVLYLQNLDNLLADDFDRMDFQFQTDEEQEVPPHFDIKPTDACVVDGSPAKFIVKISGYPKPRILWFMNDAVLSSTSLQKVYSDGSISYLEFQRCKQIGEHHIVVLAKNKLGEATANAKLVVIPENDFRPELRRVDPVFITSYENPFRKLSTLRKVEVTPELQNAMRKHKPGVVEMNRAENDGLMRSRLGKSLEASTAEDLYMNIQSRLRRSDRPAYAGAVSNLPATTASNDALQQSKEINQSQSIPQQQIYQGQPQQQVYQGQPQQQVYQGQTQQQVYQGQNQQQVYQGQPQQQVFQNKPQQQVYQGQTQQQVYQGQTKQQVYQGQNQQQVYQGQPQQQQINQSQPQQQVYQGQTQQQVYQGQPQQQINQGQPQQQQINQGQPQQQQINRGQPQQQVYQNHNQQNVIQNQPQQQQTYQMQQMQIQPKGIQSGASPVPQQQSPVPQQQSPVPPQQSPVPQQQSPVPPQQSPVPPQQSPVPPQQSPVPPQQSPTPPQQSPVPPQQSPVPQQQSPVPPQQSPVPPQQSPGPQQQSPVPPQQSPVPPQEPSTHVPPPPNSIPPPAQPIVFNQNGNPQ